MMLPPVPHACKKPMTDTPPATAVFHPAALWRRLAGLVYDLVAVLAIVMVVGMLGQLVTGGHLVDTRGDVSIAWWYRPLQYLVVVAYFVVSWLRGGQTLGMRPWRMRLRMADGTPVTPRAALLRAATVSLPLLTLTLGHVLSPRTAMLGAGVLWLACFAFALVDRHRRGLHDLAAGTVLLH